jgi:hypothetical protein
MNVILEVIRGGAQYVEDLVFLMHITAKNAHKWKKM